LGLVLEGKSETVAEARSCFEAALRHQRRAIELEPNVALYRHEAHFHASALVSSMLQSGAYADAARAVDDYLAASPKDAAAWGRAAGFLAQAGELAARDSSKSNEPFVREQFDRALACLRDAIRSGLSDKKQFDRLDLPKSFASRKEVQDLRAGLK
jgi:tetratricopeptide (TPR) repeat protein